MIDDLSEKEQIALFKKVVEGLWVGIINRHFDRLVDRFWMALLASIQSRLKPINPLTFTWPWCCCLTSRDADKMARHGERNG